MKKGLQRRQDILDAAEQLFYSKGYEATAVQDILDVLALSKGGFYHHFESKAQLLEAILAEKAQAMLARAEAALSGCAGSAADRLNVLFEHLGPWQQDERADYVLLLMQIAEREEGTALQDGLRRKTLDSALPVLSGIIRSGVAESTFFTPHPDTIGALILHLTLRLDDEILRLLARHSDPLPHILALLEVYRHAVERLLDAPFGTIVLHSLPAMSRLCDTVAAQRRRIGWQDLQP